MGQYKVKEVIKCKVTGISNFGIFVVTKDLYKGLIHISEVSNEFVRDINDYVKIDDIIYAKIIEIDENLKQLKLSIKDIDFANTGVDRNQMDLTVGFDKLKEHLPIWMDEKLKEYEKRE